MHTTLTVLAWLSVLFIRDDQTLSREVLISTAIQTGVLVDSGANREFRDYDLYIVLKDADLIREEGFLFEEKIFEWNWKWARGHRRLVYCSHGVRRNDTSVGI